MREGERNSMRRSLSENIKTGIKISILLFALVLWGLNIVHGQIVGGLDETSGIPPGRMPDDRRGIPGLPGNPSPGVQDGTGFPRGAPGTPPFPPGDQNPSPSPYGAGIESQNPQTRSDAADQQPTLDGGQPAGFPSPGLNEDAEYLKSVPEQSHPLHDFLVVLGRRPGNAIPEKEVYLHEVLSGVASPTHRRELLRAYWNLSEKMMQIHVRKAQRQRLGNAQAEMQKQQLPTDEVDLALQLVAQQELALELEFIQAQYRFLDLQSRIPAFPANRRRSSYGNEEMQDAEYSLPFENNSPLPAPHSAGYTPNEARPLPIPADFPLAVPYLTKVEELTKTRTLSQKSLLLHRTIPLQYQAIVARTAARTYAGIQCATVLEKNRQAPVVQLEALAQEEMALISTIIEYNHQVDEYVMETFGTNIPEKQLLSSILVLPKRPAAGTQQTPMRMPSAFTY